jgi:hypothetical protein
MKLTTETDKPTLTNASAVSRFLRKSGYGVVTTRTREGLHVTRSLFNTVTVTAQFDSDREAVRRATEVFYALQEADYEVTQRQQIIDVKGRAQPVKFPQSCRNCSEPLSQTEMADGYRICGDCRIDREAEKEERSESRRQK